jgi:hypothetical protein
MTALALLALCHPEIQNNVDNANLMQALAKAIFNCLAHSQIRNGVRLPAFNCGHIHTTNTRSTQQQLHDGAE